MREREREKERERERERERKRERATDRKLSCVFAKAIRPNALFQVGKSHSRAAMSKRLCDKPFAVKTH
jgi:hypothetical protein